MEKNKIIFILASHWNTNNIKRIEEFIANGYTVDVYSFFRDKIAPSCSFPIHDIGEFSNNLSYLNRIGIMYRGIKAVLKKTKHDRCIYYLIRNDVALLYSLMCRKPYIFEEADMTHLNINNSLLRNLLELRIKRIIRKSFISVFRSEGFLKCHFGNNVPENTYVIPNRLHPAVKQLSSCNKHTVDGEHLKIGFVGGIRYNSIFLFAKTLLEHFPNHEMHFYGFCQTEKDRNRFYQLKKFPNCTFHGKFDSPKDLPDIYSKIDLVLSAYDVTGINSRYAEPNKLYESIYFGVPIIVSAGTFIAEKVNRLGVGFDVDAASEDKIIAFINNLTTADILQKASNAACIAKDSCINENPRFFEMLANKLNNLSK